jgi:hypothetical protein
LLSCTLIRAFTMEFWMARRVLACALEWVKRVYSGV